MAKVAGWFVVVVFGFAASACGGSGGTTPTEQAVQAPPCPVQPVPGHGSSYAGSCNSPDGAWHLRIRELSGSQSKLFLLRQGQSTSTPMYASKGCCLQAITWAKPHLLLFIDNFQVTSLDPPSHKARYLAQLNDLAVTPDGRWFAGRGAGTLSSNVYVLSADARKCLVVPGNSVSVQGFTPDSKAVIILRAYKYPKTRLIQYAISTLRPGCPTGYNGVLLHKG